METFEANLGVFVQWLLRATLQGSLLVCLILLIKLILRERLPARWHYCLWLILLIRLVLPWAPPSRISIYGLIPGSSSAYRAISGLPAARFDEREGRSSTSIREGIAKRAFVADQRRTSEPAQSGAADPAALQPSEKTSASPQEPSPGASSRDHRVVLPVISMLTWVWLAGVICLAGYTLLRALGLWRAVTSERPVTDQEILDLLEDCKMQMRVRTLVGVVVTDKIQTPALFGFLRPRILLPQGLIESLGLDALDCVFLHELAHLKRRDIYLAWLVCLLQVLHWFNPLIWFAFRRMRADQEMAADALALSTAGTEDFRRYGQTIVNLLERFSRPQYLPSLAGILENPPHIERRIHMIARSRSNSRPWSALGVGVVVVFGVIAMIDPTRGTVSASSVPEVIPPVLMRLVQKEIQDDVSMSPDGRYLCGCGTWAERGEIVIRELATGKQRTIKPTKRIPEETNPQDPIMSPDNKLIAYRVSCQERADVCLIEADGSSQRILYPGIIRSIKEAAGSGPPLPYPGIVRPIQWFPDGNRFLGSRWADPTHAFTEIQIVSISIADGSVQVIKTLTGEFFGTIIRLSPDAKYVAYELTSKDAPTKHDIFAIEIDSKRETPLVGHAADDRLLGWTPDGRHILFISDRMGPWGAWLLPVAKGQPEGTPALVAGSTGALGPVGFAENGSYYYHMRYGASDIYTAAINVSTGQLLSAPSPLEAAGSNKGADWSPDGKYLAYCSKLPTAGEPGVIRIRSLATGQERELLHELPEFYCLRWSPDGRSLLASWWTAYKPEDLPFTRRVYRIDAATGETTLLLDSKHWDLLMAELSPDGKTLYYTAEGIIRREIDTGQEKTIFTYPPKGPWAGWALSPNGEFIVTGCNEGTEKSRSEGGVKKVLLIPSQGGQATELLRWDEEPTSFLTNTSWSPDGKTVLFTLHREPVAGRNEKQVDELWQVSTDGGQLRKIMETDLSMSRRQGFRIHPDGQRIAFSAAVGHGELWAMENFPPARASTKDSK